MQLLGFGYLSGTGAHLGLQSLGLVIVNVCGIVQSVGMCDRARFLCVHEDIQVALVSVPRISRLECTHMMP